MKPAASGAGHSPLASAAPAEAVRERASAAPAREWLELVHRLVRRRTALFGAIVVALVIATALAAA